jgi:hypothetical protein
MDTGGTAPLGWGLVTVGSPAMLVESGALGVTVLGLDLVGILLDLDLDPVTSTLAVASLALTITVLIVVLRRRRRRRRLARAADGGTARAFDGGVRGSSRNGAGPVSSAPVRRPGASPLFAERGSGGGDRDTELDRLAERLRAATGPLEVIEALRSLDVPDASDALPGPGSGPGPGPGPGPGASVHPVVVPQVLGVTPFTVDRRPVARPFEMPPVGWMLAGGATALLVARWFRRDLRGD